MAMITLLRRACMLVCAVALAGCTTTRSVRAYPGVDRPDAELAVVRCDYRFGSTMMSIEWVDGMRVRPWSWWHRPAVTEARITPGRHVVQVSFVRGGTHSTRNLPLPLQAEAGHTYEVFMAIRPESDWVELRNAFFGGPGAWTAWIVDADSGATVSGRNPDAPK
jgi:hypothetical protein